MRPLRKSYQLCGGGLVDNCYNDISTDDGKRFQRDLQAALRAAFADICKLFMIT